MITTGLGETMWSTVSVAVPERTSGKVRSTRLTIESPIVATTLPPASSIVEAAVENVTVAVDSSSEIVPVNTVSMPRVASVGVPRVTWKISSPSAKRSSMMVTSTNTIVSPGAKMIGLAGIV